MTPENPDNGFTTRRHDEYSGGDAARWSGVPRLSNLVAPIRAVLIEQPFGFSLDLEPMELPQVLQPWWRLDVERPTTLLVTETGSIIAAARRWASNESFEVLSDRAAIVDDDSLNNMLSIFDVNDLWMIRIDGEVEPRDAEAIIRAIDRHRTPLEAEMRAVAAIPARGDQSLRLDVRSRRDAAGFVGERLRLYLAALRNRAPREIASPEPAIIERLLDLTGQFSVRPIETQTYSTAVDIGIGIGENGEIRPASESLIYDLYSNTWHGE